MAAEQTVEQRMKMLAEALWNDSELGARVQAKAKEMFPDAKTNADVIDPILNPLRAENKKLAERLEKFEQERADEKRSADESKQKQTLEAALESARKNYSLTEEGFDKMVSRMKETGNYSDADAAAAWVASKTPPKDVKGPTFGTKKMNLFGVGKYDESMKELHRDPLDYLDNQLEEFAANPDKYVADTFGAAA